SYTGSWNFQNRYKKPSPPMKSSTFHIIVRSIAYGITLGPPLVILAIARKQSTETETGLIPPPWFPMPGFGFIGILYFALCGILLEHFFRWLKRKLAPHPNATK